MGICSNCGNSYDSSFTVIMNDESYEFDSFECAIHKLAPHCDHCATPIIGHGLQDKENLFCSAHCARMKGQNSLRDRVAIEAELPS